MLFEIRTFGAQETVLYMVTQISPMGLGTFEGGGILGHVLWLLCSELLTRGSDVTCLPLLQWHLLISIIVGILTF